ncbi:DUF523 and DUF1722 domain-containing protein [Candidatus Bipolaricaulota bacterium]|nr:DUF523 and DUF1722 domain-containing protein [Candidatus Bipolaricaulota bacterium]
MDEFVTPRVILSKCIEHDHCRYNGGIVSSRVVKTLEPYVEYVTVCPEVEIGLGVPRDSLRLVQKGSGPRLIQSQNKKDYTEKMEDFADGFLAGLQGVDGAVLKNRSPSCGTKDVRIYAVTDNSPVVDKGPGAFGAKVKEKLGGKPIENEGRLRSHKIREKFYTSLFAVARYRNGVENEPRMEDLIEFHARHKYILLANDEGRLRKMGRLVANDEGRDVEDLIEPYGENLSAALRNEVNPNAHVNVLQHAYGYFSDDLNDDEKSLFFEYVENYRAGKVPLSTLISMVRSWIRRFNQEYLADQYYFNPYPSDLADISDSGKGVDL